MNNRPLVKLIIPFILGMFVAKFFPLFFNLTVLLAALIVSFTGFLILKFLVKRMAGLLYPSALAYFTVFVAGYFLYSLSWFQNQKTADSLQGGFLIGKVSTIPKNTGKAVKVVLNVEAIKHSNVWNKVDGKVVVYFKDTAAQKLKTGDRLLLDVNLHDIEDAGNPEEFSYKNYLAFHFITKQAFIDAGRWKKLGEDKSIFGETGKLREKIIKIIDSSGLSDENRSVIKALTVGYKENLQAETKQKFSSTGAMHVLAVSGLHVGIIFIILNFLFFPVRKITRNTILPSLLIILLLWFYAAITGLSPSVTRATLMFTLLQIGKMLNRDSDIYNTIAASAFIILLINPFTINSIGFWLSYSAVLGIVILYPVIYRGIYINTERGILFKLLDKVWALIAVSLSAQIATLPITIYFFHSFPVYFLITNLIVIPIVPFIMYSALGMILFFNVPWLFGWFSKLTGWITHFMISLLEKVEDLPYHSLTELSLSTPNFLLMYFFIIFFLLYLVKAKRKMLVASLSVLLLMFAINTYNIYSGKGRKVFVVYNIGGYSAMNFIDGRDNIIVSDVKTDKNKLTFAAKNYWLKLGLEKEKIIDVDKLNEKFLFSSFWTIDNPAFFFYKNYIKFYNLRLAIVDNSFRYKNLLSHNRLNLDYVILRNNADVKISQLVKLYNFDKLIIDSSNSFFKIRKWQNECKKLNVHCFVVRKQGAFVKPISV
jgi:competence protein ComEC